MSMMSAAAGGMYFHRPAGGGPSAVGGAGAHSATPAGANPRVSRDAAQLLLEHKEEHLAHPGYSTDDVTNENVHPELDADLAVTIDDVKRQLAQMGVTDDVPDHVVLAFLQEKRAAAAARRAKSVASAPQPPAMQLRGAGAARAAGPLMSQWTPATSVQQLTSDAHVQEQSFSMDVSQTTQGDDELDEPEYDVSAELEDASFVFEVGGTPPRKPMTRQSSAPVHTTTAGASRHKTVPKAAAVPVVSAPTRPAQVPKLNIARRVSSPDLHAQKHAHDRTPERELRRKPRVSTEDMETAHGIPAAPVTAAEPSPILLGAPGVIHAKSVVTLNRRRRHGKTDPVSLYHETARAWEKNTATARAIRQRPVVTPRADIPRRHTRTIPATARPYVVPTDKRRDDVRMEIRRKMLWARYNAEAAQHKTKPSLPGAYVTPGDNRRDELRWNVRTRMLSAPDQY